MAAVCARTAVIARIYMLYKWHILYSMDRAVISDQRLVGARVRIIHDDGACIVCAHWPYQDTSVRFSEIDMQTGIVTPIPFNAHSLINSRCIYNTTVFVRISSIAFLMENNSFIVCKYDAVHRQINTVRCGIPADFPRIAYINQASCAVTSELECVVYTNSALHHLTYHATGQLQSRTVLSNNISLQYDRDGGFAVTTCRARSIVLAAAPLHGAANRIHMFNTAPVTCSTLVLPHNNLPERLALSADGYCLAVLSWLCPNDIFDITIMNVVVGDDNVVALAQTRVVRMPPTYLSEMDLSVYDAAHGRTNLARTFGFGCGDSHLSVMCRDGIEMLDITNPASELTLHAAQYHECAFTEQGVLLCTSTASSYTVKRLRIRNLRVNVLLIVVSQLRAGRRRLPAELWEWMTDEFNMLWLYTDSK